MLSEGVIDFRLDYLQPDHRGNAYEKSKTSGGPTSGRCKTETQRTIWLLSISACAEIVQANEEYSNTTYLKSVQHKNSTKAKDF